MTTTPSDGFTIAEQTSLTFSHTSDANPLYVLLSWWVALGAVNTADVVTGVTFDGVALTRGGRAPVSGNTMEWWLLDAPTTGTHNVVISLNTAKRVTAGVVNLSGWPTTTAEHSFAYDSANASPPSFEVDSRDDAEVLTWIGFNHPDQNVTIPAGSTELWNQEGENVTGGPPADGDQRSAGSFGAGASPSVTLVWSGTETVEFFGVAALSFAGSKRNLLTGLSHEVTGSDNFIAGQDNIVTGGISQAHGQDVEVIGHRSVAFNLDGVPRTLIGDGKFWLNGEEISGGASVGGPGSSTDNAIARWNGTTGNTLQNSTPIVQDDGRISTVTDPTSAQDVATKNYVDGLALNLGTRATVRAATTANIAISTALNNGDTLDGVTLATGNLVLVKNQSSAAENGVYVVGVTPSRSLQFDTYDEHPGALIVVQEGTANADTLWFCTSNAGGTLNTTAITFSAVSTSGSTGDVVGPSSSIDGEIVLFDSTTGKLIKRATGTGFVRAASGVYSASKLKRQVSWTIGNGTAVIATGAIGCQSCPVAGTITKVRVFSVDAAVTSGSVVIDIWKDTYANFPPTVADTITASAKPTISSSNKYEDSTLTGWTTSVSAGDFFRCNVDSVTSFKLLVVELTVDE